MSTGPIDSLDGALFSSATVRVLRFVPDKDTSPHFEEYAVPFRPGMTVLDVVVHLREHVDPSLGFSYCCRNGHCGLCGAMINGKPGLMCREPATPELILKPLSHLPVQRDLVMDWGAIEDQLQSLRLFLDRAGRPPALPEYVAGDVLESFKAVSRCVRCYCCVAACPVVGRLPHLFAGPAPAVLLARHVIDPRDELDRRTIAAGLGVSHCVHCGACDPVCPQGIAPGKVVGMMKEWVADADVHAAQGPD